MTYEDEQHLRDIVGDDAFEAYVRADPAPMHGLAIGMLASGVLWLLIGLGLVAWLG